MRFLNPAGAWALLGLLPVIALYLLRKKTKPQSVPSLLLWRRVDMASESSRPFQRLRNKLLLWIQLLLVALMALIFMRPATLGASAGARVLVFDLSASMQATLDGRSRIELAKERALELLGDMAGETTVLGAGESVLQIAVRSGDPVEVATAINGLAAQNGRADMDGALSLALAMKRDLPQTEVVVLSDAYRADRPDVTVVGVGVGADNRSLTDLRISESEAGAFVYASVSNYGQVAEITLECYADGALCDLRSTTLEADESRSVRFTLPAGAQEVEARIVESDALLADNARYAAAQTVRERNALLVTSGNIFLERALSLRDELVLYKADDPAQAGQYDLYIYDGMLPDELPEAGALLVLAPSREVMGITPVAQKQDASALRLASGAGELGEHLSLSDVAIRDFTPLSGEQAVLVSGDSAVLSVSELEGRRIAVLGFDVHQSNLPLKADFPVLIQNLLGYLLPDAQTAIAGAECGDTITLPLDDQAVSASVTKPSGAETTLAGNVLRDTDEIGLYTLAETLENGETREARFAVHMPASEADIRAVAQSASGANADDAAQTGSREWTGWLLALWLLVLMLEWEVSRRGVSR